MLEVRVVECARRVIHGPGQHARKGQRSVMRRCHPRRPLQILLAHHAFARDQVGIGTPQPIGFERAVVVDHQMMLGCCRHYLPVPLHHPLVVAIHKVDLYARDAPILKERKRLVHVLVHRRPMRPQPQLHVLFLRVAQ